MTTQDKLLLTRTETCGIGGFGLSSLKGMLQRGELREIRIGRRSLIARSELERFIRERMTERS
jgi:hypothetical protein